MRRPMTILALLLPLAVVGMPAAAQTVALDGTMQEVGGTTTIAIEPPGGGEPREYAISDISLSLSRSMDYGGQPRVDISVSFSFQNAFDPFLLEWVSLGEDGAQNARDAIVTVAGPGEARPPVRYEMEGARVISFSATHSTMSSFSPVALQVSLRRLSIDGVAMN